jgi:hypothetical protein
VQRKISLKANLFKCPGLVWWKFLGLISIWKAAVKLVQMANFVHLGPLQGFYKKCFFPKFCWFGPGGGQPKLVFGPQLENFAKIRGFSDRMITKTWRNTPKMSKNRWFSILVWATGWPLIWTIVLIWKLAKTSKNFNELQNWQIYIKKYKKFQEICIFHRNFEAGDLHKILCYFSYTHGP